MRNPCAKRAVPPSRWAAPFARDVARLSRSYVHVSALYRLGAMAIRNGARAGVFDDDDAPVLRVARSFAPGWDEEASPSLQRVS